MQVSWQNYWEIKLIDFYIAIPFIVFVIILLIIYWVFKKDD